MSPSLPSKTYPPSEHPKPATWVPKKTREDAMSGRLSVAGGRSPRDQSTPATWRRGEFPGGKPRVFMRGPP